VRHGPRAGHERCDLPPGRLQECDVSGRSWKDHHDVTGNGDGVAWKLSGRDDGLALSASPHPDQRLHRQPGRLRPNGHPVLHLGSPGHTWIIQLYLHYPRVPGYTWLITSPRDGCLARSSASSTASHKVRIYTIQYTVWRSVFCIALQPRKDKGKGRVLAIQRCLHESDS